jgi:hypothetical protein
MGTEEASFVKGAAIKSYMRLFLGGGFSENGEKKGERRCLVYSEVTH